MDAALDGPLLDDVFRVRHEVYCEDLKFETERPDHREIDEFDVHSVQMLRMILSNSKIARRVELCAV